MSEFYTRQVAGFLPALWGMRHPLKSYAKSDTIIDEHGNAVIGPNDYDLAKRLCRVGSPEHAKFLRQIVVWADITLPRYVWSEFDTYRIGVDKNSQSTMHRLLRDYVNIEDVDFPWGENVDVDSYMLNQIHNVNSAIFKYKETNDPHSKEKLFIAIKALLPEGYLQTRTVSLNYQALKTMYHQRKNHLLPQWNTDFVKWVHTLPYSEFITDEWPEN